MTSHGKASHETCKPLICREKFRLETKIKKHGLQTRQAGLSNLTGPGAWCCGLVRAGEGMVRPGPRGKGLPPKGGAGSPRGGAFSHRSHFLQSGHGERFLTRRDVCGSALGSGVWV